MKKNILRVKIIYYDFFILNKLVWNLKKISLENNVKFKGPISLPTRITKYDVLRSPHVNKDSRDQLQISVHKKFIDFFNVFSSFIINIRDLCFFYSLDFNFKFLNIKKW